MAGHARPTDTPRYHLPPAFVLILLMVIFGALLPEPATAVPAETDTLLIVNGQTVTAADLDRLIMEGHAMFRMEEETSGLVDKVLNKWTNDQLLLDDAFAAGMDQEPEQVAYVEKQQRLHAIEAYVDDHFERRAVVPEDSIQAFVDRYYWQIQLRRLSVRTREEAEQLRAEIIAGADMDALARELSLDTKKPTGGLYPLLYWADVENRLREQVGHLQEGEVSAIFPYNDAFTFVRVEQRLGVDEDAFAKNEAFILGSVRTALSEQRWKEFVDGHIARYEVSEDFGELASIVADSAVVIQGDFLKKQPGVVIEVADGPAATGTELRAEISTLALQDALQPFAVHLDEGRRKVTTDLVLAKAAEEAGYFEDPAVVAKVAKDEEQALIQLYLSDVIASKIKFNREELDEFYVKHQERFRGPSQYRLDILFLEEEAKALEAAQRLAEGADFAFIWREYRPGEEPTLGQSNFITAEQLSEPFRIHLEGMEPGDTSPAIKMSMGWMIFKLDAVREGQVAPLEKVEMEIRKVVYQLKFNEYMDEHLALLREQSDIERREDRVKAYILSGE